MAIPHAIPGQPVDVGPLGTRVPLVLDGGREASFVEIDVRQIVVSLLAKARFRV